MGPSVVPRAELWRAGRFGGGMCLWPATETTKTMNAALSRAQLRRKNKTYEQHDPAMQRQRRFQAASRRHLSRRVRGRDGSRSRGDGLPRAEAHDAKGEARFRERTENRGW